ncbi:MAG: hypothetical protein EOO20_19750 [Chryseobacterium sp.]|nr:MAG: hypothetical protein EOO20_19750 [Chryseobacterium sp.]
MRKLTTISILLMIFTNFQANSQPGVGCLRNLDGRLYTVKNGFGFYELLLTNYPTTPPACPRVSLGTKTGVTCRFLAGGPANDEYNYILYNATGPYQCDIDHYGYGALAIAGFLAFRRIRKN